MDLEKACVHRIWSLIVLLITVIDPAINVDILVQEGSTDIDLVLPNAGLYEIINQTRQGTFHIDITGHVGLTGYFDLDYETIPVHTIVYRLSSSNSETSTGSIIISVSDANDHAPVFSEDVYFVSLSAASYSGSPVITLNSTDADGSSNNNQILNYTIVNGNDNDAFIISNTGTISVNLDYKMSTSDKTIYGLVITATDNGLPQLTGTTTVAVITCGTNDALSNLHGSGVVFTLFFSTATGIQLFLLKYFMQ